MDDATTYPPTTAYEVLKSLFPEHDLHTVVKAIAHPKSVSLRCSCGDDKLTVSDKTARRFNWSLQNVRHALRNVL